jgi:predicted MPP superfamily phosphohydrolase
MLVMIELVLLIGACVGHVAIFSYSLNRWYGRPFPRQVLLSIRGIHGIVVVLGLGALLWVYRQDHFEMPFAGHNVRWVRIAVGYALLSSFVGLIVVPVSLFRRWLGSHPRILESNHTYTVDIAKELGYKPVGRGKYRVLATLPANEIFQVDFSEKTLLLPELPIAWHGLSILHLSDLHFCDIPLKVFYQRVLDKCADWHPDLVALTGDYVDSKYHHRWLLPVLGHLRWRIAALAILGNHDTWFDMAMIRRRIARLGIRVLANSWQLIEVRGQPLAVIGNEAPWLTPAPDLENCPTDAFRLCLSHTPDNLAWARQQRINLMLAGHNHGGQIRFPIFGSLLVPSKYGCRYDCGTFHEPPTVLHVSRGLGARQPIRLLCRPEVTKLILKRAP